MFLSSSSKKDKSSRALCTHEVVEGTTDSLNEVCTRKIMKELSKAEAAQLGCCVDITKANLISSDDEDGSDAGI